MVLFFDVAKVKTRMALMDVPAANPAIQEAIESAHTRVAGELDTVFERKANTEIFLLDYTKCGYVVPDGFFRLRLKNGFVRGDVAITVEVASNPEFDMADVADPAKYHLEAERGILYVSELYSGSYVRVTYTSGFDAGEACPDWLVDGIISYVPVAFYKDQTTNKPGGIESLKLAQDHMLSVLGPHLRKMGFILNPIY